MSNRVHYDILETLNCARHKADCETDVNAIAKRNVVDQARNASSPRTQVMYKVSVTSHKDSSLLEYYVVSVDKLGSF